VVAFFGLVDAAVPRDSIVKLSALRGAAVGRAEHRAEAGAAFIHAPRESNAIGSRWLMSNFAVSHNFYF